MKARLNLILALLLIAITISLIAVSFGWYAAEAGEVFFENSSVTVQTADSEFYYGGANFTFINTMSRTDETTFKTHHETLPYFGQDGIFSGEYIILLKMEKNGADSEGNPLNNNGYPYIEHVDLYTELVEEVVGNEIVTRYEGVDETLSTFYEGPEDYKKDFQIIFVDYDESTGEVMELEERNNDVTPEYIAIIFGNGSSIFKYSSNEFLGYKFVIYLDYYNDVDE